MEERRRVKNCPEYGYSVSSFSCLMCSRYEVKNQLTTTVTKKSGACRFPRRASKESRKITGDFFFQLYDRKRSKREEKKKKKGGMSDKRNFMVELISQGVEREEVQQRVSAKFKRISEAYFNTIFYQAKKEVRNGNGS